MRLKLLIAVSTVLAAGGAGFLVWQNSSEEASPVEPVPADIQKFVNEMIARGESLPLSPQASPPTRPPSPPPSPSPPEAVCTGSDDANFNCYDQYYADLVNNYEIKVAMSDLRARYDGNGYIRSQCHPLTHVIGRAAAKKFSNVADAFSQGDGYCWSGYYHGVMETFINRVGYDNLTSQINDLCKSLREKNQYAFDHYNCVHGLGHGVMAITDNELFESLELCDSVQDSWERASCWSGAFMENIIVDGKNHFTKYLKPDLPLYPCDAVGEQYKGTCYLMQTSYMLKVLGGDFARVFAECGKVEAAHRLTCYQSLGRDASGRSTSNVQQTITWCNLGTDLEQREHCFIGAVKDFISYFHSDVQAKELCSAITEEQIQNSCQSTAAAYYQLF